MTDRPRRVIHLLRSPDGSLCDLGRNGHGARRGEGPAVVYRGEALEVMNLVLKYSGGALPLANSVSHHVNADSLPGKSEAKDE